MDNKYIRYLLGFIILAVILASFFSKTVLLIVSSLFIIISMIEYRNMFKVKNIFPHLLIPEMAGIILAYFYIFGGDELLVLSAGYFLAFFATIIFNKKPYFYTALSTIAAIFFIFCGLYIIKLYNSYNYIVIILYFISVLAGDFSASKIGPKIKPIYIFPDISPNKTFAGSFSNIIITCIICGLLHPLLGYKILSCIIIGLTVSVFAQVGDLTISLIKRDLGIKHSGTLFSDYGGIWDRIDAFLFSAPALYYILMFVS